MSVTVILTDIEGTTSSIDFVHKVLFPYASKELPAFVRAHKDDRVIAAILDDARAAAASPDADIESLIATMQQWIAEDQKVTALKELQGHIWKHGYQAGDFTGHMYRDAVDYLHHWRDAGIALYVYSSGSVGAQQLLFGHSDAGDLTSLFSGYFDTMVGHKREVDAYIAIAGQIGVPAENILFLSDVAEELDAAASAGMQTVQLVRDDKVAVGTHRIASNFGQVEL